MKHLEPRQAWSFLQAHPEAILLDIRMEIEAMYVGAPPGAVNIPWYEYPELTPDAVEFVQAVVREAGSKDKPILLLCRSAKRTIPAGQALIDAGFSDVINILHGFEGDLDEQFQRSTVNGWRFDGLPWTQT
jgi:rhodanese-related sulfurtransferase